MKLLHSPLELKRIIWNQLGFVGRGYRPKVYFVPGNSSPKLCGKCFHYTNRSGGKIKFPSAYAKVGWSSLVYVHSSYRIEVGIDWDPIN